MESFLLSAFESSITHSLSQTVSMVSGTGVVKISAGTRTCPSLRPVPPESLPRARSSPFSRVHVPGTLRSVVVLQPQTGLTANLQGFRTGAPEGWPLLQCRGPALDSSALYACGGHLGSGASRAPPWPLRAQERQAR